MLHLLKIIQQVDLVNLLQYKIVLPQQSHSEVTIPLTAGGLGSQIITNAIRANIMHSYVAGQARGQHLTARTRRLQSEAASIEIELPQQESTANQRQEFCCRRISQQHCGAQPTA